MYPRFRLIVADGHGIAESHFAHFFKKIMEELRELFPHVPPDRLESVLRSCKGRVEDAAAILADDNQPAQTCTQPENLQVKQDLINVNLPAECFTVDLFKKALASQKTKIWHDTDNLPNFKTAAFFDLKDGNCGPHALASMLTFMTNEVPTKLSEHQFMAKEIREYVSDFLFLNWLNPSMIANEPWHDIVYFSHNVAISDEERSSFPDWGPDPMKRLEAWVMERDEHFYTQSDFISFNEAMQHHGISAVFRIWRKVR